MHDPTMRATAENERVKFMFAGEHPCRRARDVGRYFLVAAEGRFELLALRYGICSLQEVKSWRRGECSAKEGAVVTEHKLFEDDRSVGIHKSFVLD